LTGVLNSDPDSTGPVDPDLESGYRNAEVALKTKMKFHVLKLDVLSGGLEASSGTKMSF
jgi:hypothetical protein